MQRFLINFSYDGSNYNGYQKQNGLNTVQGEMEKALKYINNGIYTKLVSSGRTDALVHANNQYAHVDISVNITEEKLKQAINSLVKNDIYVKSTKIVNKNFHARFDVIKKEYIYILNMGEYSPIKRNYEYQYCKMLNIDKMKEAIEKLKGTHDFQNFSSNEIREKSTIKTIYDAYIKKDGDIIIFTFCGNGFLRYMVRVMVGILISVGEEKINPEDIDKIFDGTFNKNYKKVAKACGLYLNNVEYKKI